MMRRSRCRREAAFGRLFALVAEIGSDLARHDLAAKPCVGALRRATTRPPAVGPAADLR
jgi:hypothetical protein